MHCRHLGKSPLKVSVITLGTMMFGDTTDQAEAARIVDHAHEHGINFIDTADVYTKGASETMVGALIKPKRDDWILATKLGNKMSERVNESQYSRKWMVRECDASLTRLGTDFIDVLYMHRDFEGSDLDEPVMAMGDLIRAGKIRYFGLSNFRGYRIAEVVARCRALNIPPPVVVQPYYNLLNRMPEVEILPACDRFGIGVAPYSPIARGVLTGKYVAGAAPEAGSRAARGDKRIMETEFREESFKVAAELKQYLAAKNVSTTHFAVAWLLANRIVSTVIAGPRTFAQWTDYFAAIDLVIDAADEAKVDALVPLGHPSTPGYNDPVYPIMGRRLR